MAISGSASSALPKGCVLAPIHRVDDSTPLVMCVLTQTAANPAETPFVLLRDLPGARIYLGAVCDALGNIQEWVEVQAQTLDVKQLEFSGQDQPLTNTFFDARWRTDGTVMRSQMPDAVIATRMEVENPAPILIKRARENGPFAPIEVVSWRLCKDDDLLKSRELPAYSTSPFRYLYQPESKDAKIFIAASSDAPVNAHVETLDQIKTSADVQAIFNPGCGFIRVVRYSPMELESYLQILEGKAWNDANSETSLASPRSVYSELRDWSANPRGLPFLLHGKTGAGERLNEIFLLKLCLLHDILKNVRAFVKGHQAPLLNLSPASFRVHIRETGDLFPGLWSAESQLVKSGQACPLEIQSTEHRYFIRLGHIEPTPFFPGSIGTHSFGVASAQIRDVHMTADRVVLEGTLVAEDFLMADPHDLLWFKLPLGEGRLEFYGHAYKSDGGGPREARFRTLPAMLPETVVAKLKASAGVRFSKAPYEIRPLLSSPCDLYSLGVIGVRILLANNLKNLPVLLDEILSLARRVNDGDPAKRVPELQKLVQSDTRLYDLLSPAALVESGYTSQEAWSAIHGPTWLETMSLLLRFFPDSGGGAFCKSLGDVSPVALETVFDPALQALEVLVLRMRSLFTPVFSTNEEIASVIAEQIAKG
ncbi:MAG TPA: hypothetical protein VMF08_12470 [Candidatus Sulfotelmatobacter sp.]|nr:hypothetical protein [Candidatus Sulfotelmatobacter sp.]